MTRYQTDEREPPVVLVNWHGFTRRLPERVGSFPENQRFVLGTRLADLTFDVLETFLEEVCDSCGP